MAGIGLAYFPGIDKIASFSMTFSHGISPSVCVIEITPQENFPAADGELRLAFESEEITFKDCHIDSMSYSRDQGGRVWRLAILDRRWKWSMAGKNPISGIYNSLEPSTGKIDVKTEQPPRALATLCLEAMGEQDFDVSELPNETRPEITWDYEIPAEALAGLCDSLGCRVVLQLDNKVKIRKLGNGGDLPGASGGGGVPVTDDSGTVDPPERPDKLLLVGANNRYQDMLKLEPVALEPDGRIVKLDDVSYKPADGWGNISLEGDEWEDIGDEGGLVNGVSAMEIRKCAAESVYRWYRIIGRRDGTLNFPHLPKKLERIDQIFPVEDTRVEQFTDPFDGRKKDKPARVVGKWFEFGLDGANIEDLEDDGGDGGGRDHEYPGGFSIDGERGLVIFSRPVAREEEAVGLLFDTSAWAPANIFLECSFGYRDPDTRALVRYERELKAKGKPNGSGARVYKDEGFAQTKRVLYDSFGNQQGIKDNLDELHPRADAFLKEAGTEYQIKQPRDLKYAGLIKIDLDGAIQQVCWEGRVNQGCTTRASRNNEFANYIPGYKERRRLENNRGREAELARLANLFRDRGPRDNA